MPALPASDVGAAAAFYNERLGFEIKYQDQAFAILKRDDAELHLWAANDQGWKDRSDLADKPVCSGAESFIAGTASCRIEVDQIDTLHEEMAGADVLHPGDQGHAVDTDWRTREFAAIDSDGNLLTFYQRP